MNRLQVFITTLLTLGSLVGFQGSAFALPGDLDISFGGDGWVSTQAPGSNGSLGTSLLVQPDQKIVAGGMAAFDNNNLDFCLTRYLPDGSLDNTFGNGGIVLTDFPGNDGNRPADFISDLAIQRDGKIVAAGGSVLGTNLPISQMPPNAGDLNFALARYLPNGSLDPSFGVNGLVSLDFSGIAALDQINSVKIQRDGKIVAAGQVAVARGSSNYDFAVARFNEDGSLDPSFGNGGQVRIDFFQGSNASANALQIQGDGKILLAGSTNQSSLIPGNDFALARLNTDGSLDVSFGNGGLVTTNFLQAQFFTQNSDDIAYGLLLQGDGKIVTAGVSIEQNPLRARIALARYLSDGSLDVAFGDRGKVLTDFSDLNPNAFADGRDLVLQGDGKILVAGNVMSDLNQPFNSDFALARYLPDGQLDGTYGRGGKVVANFPEQQRGLDGANEIALQADGKALAVGYVQLGQAGNTNLLAFGLARFEGDKEVITETPEEETGAPREAPGLQLVLQGGACAFTPSPGAPNFSLWIETALVMAFFLGFKFLRRPKL